MTRPAEVDALSSALADRYAIERELGRGGMATVYLARDLKHPRQVALKVLRPEVAGALGADRFLKEIEVVSRLQHPHILGLLDSGTAGDVLYYVMPYVEGESLRHGWTGSRNSSWTPRSPLPGRWRGRWTTPTATASFTPDPGATYKNGEGTVRVVVRDRDDLCGARGERSRVSVAGQGV